MDAYRPDANYNKCILMSLTCGIKFLTNNHILSLNGRAITRTITLHLKRSSVIGKTWHIPVGKSKDLAKH